MPLQQRHEPFLGGCRRLLQLGHIQGQRHCSLAFSERERLAIEYAERIAELPRELPYNDEFWDRLCAKFDDGEIVDLTYSITTWIATGRFVHALGLDGTCPTGPAERVQLVIT